MRKVHQPNRLASSPQDETKWFTPADVAILRPETEKNYKKRRAALVQSRNLLRRMTGCVEENNETGMFIYHKSPTRDGLDICRLCVFHRGGKKGIIQIQCEENNRAREATKKSQPSLSAFMDSELRQLTFL